MEKEEMKYLANEVYRVFQTFRLNADYSSGRITSEQRDDGLAELAKKC